MELELAKEKEKRTKKRRRRKWRERKKYIKHYVQYNCTAAAPKNKKNNKNTILTKSQDYIDWELKEKKGDYSLVAQCSSVRLVSVELDQLVQ